MGGRIEQPTQQLSLLYKLLTQLRTMLLLIVAVGITSPWFSLLLMAILSLLCVIIFRKYTFKSHSDFYLAMLFAFLATGVGLLYLGEAKKGSKWLCFQAISFFIAAFCSSITVIESKYIGLILFAPFLLQLIETVIG